MLIGRPLAVVRARLTLETAGLPAWSQDWADTGARDTAGFDGVRFPVQLGVTELLDDGLVGFYLDDDYQQIDTAYSITDPGPYVGSRRPEVSVADRSGVLLTLVMDPACQVHAISGILPPVVQALPGSLSSPALGSMAVTFRAGPVLGPPGIAAMPLPALRDGTWSWLQYADTEHPARQQPVLLADATAALPDPAPQLREGWLKLLLEGPPTVLTYAVQPTTVSTSGSDPRAATATLRFTAFNGSGAAVDCSQITFEVPVGRGEPDLSPDLSTVTASVLPGASWQITGDGHGQFTATPEEGHATVDAGATLTFQLAGLAVGALPGMVTVGVHEVTDAARRAETFLAKVPPMPATQLTYTAEPLAVPVGSRPTIAVTAYNASPATVYLTRLVLTLPVGDRDDDLTSDAAGLVVDLPGWTVTSDGAGAATAFPVGPPPAVGPGSAVRKTVSRFTVAAPAGPVLVRLSETAGTTPSAPPVPGTAGAALLLSKTDPGGGDR